MASMIGTIGKVTPAILEAQEVKKPLLAEQKALGDRLVELLASIEQEEKQIRVRLIELNKLLAEIDKGIAA